MLQVNAFHISMAPDSILSFSDKQGMHHFQKSTIALTMVDNPERIKDKESGHMSLFCADKESTTKKARDNHIDDR